MVRVKECNEGQESVFGLIVVPELPELIAVAAALISRLQLLTPHLSLSSFPFLQRTQSALLSPHPASLLPCFPASFSFSTGQHPIITEPLSSRLLVSPSTTSSTTRRHPLPFPGTLALSCFCWAI
jgi:hypothetical protein